MGKFEIKILNSVVAKLKTLQNGAFGTLLTSTENEDGSFAILGLAITNLGGEENSPIDSEFSILHSPGGLVYLGSFAVTSDNVVEVESDMMVLKFNPETSELTAEHEEQGDVDLVTITAADVARDFFMVRTRLVLPFSAEMSEDGLRSSIQDCKQMVDEIAIAEVKDLEKPFITPGAKKSYKSLNDIEIVELTISMQANAAEDSDVTRGVLFDYKKRTAKCCWFDLMLDTLTLVPRSEPASYLIDMVGLSLRQYLTLFENCLVSQLDQPDNFSIPQVFHFLPDEVGHFISAVYPMKKLDRDLGEFRSFLHQSFVLPTDRPLLMRGNAFPFTQETAGKELLCPHEGVGVSGVVGGEPALVQGRYTYHHYCQQGVSDDGWGCAYRSLQTLCSWFRLQGYTNRPVPTIKEIQECLVSIGDKPPNFIGSSQWIGSTEVGFCLDTLLGVSCRIGTVSSGEEMGMKGGELTHHFKTQGTPVMIGGGNLAHTILGVDYNKKTGDIKFLILDPHYTGGEDLNVILSKGWCGWKPLSFWKKGCFYNMCMPIRPKCV